MTKDIPIPPEVWMAAQACIGDHVEVAVIKAALAAAIAAWPGVSEIVVGINRGSIILPLPKETRE